MAWDKTLLFMKNIEIELLSPAGSWESLNAAMQAGADAIYFGVGALNMRAKGSMNFSVADIPEIAALCRSKGVRSYLTLNTILYDHDLILAREIIDQAKFSGIDAVIAFDITAIMYAHEAGIPVHISTQANITNAGSVKFFSAYADVMVLSRELTLEQVGLISQAIRRNNICGPSGRQVKLEIFAHGALCMAVSGKCYMSLHTDFSSANRGACVQNCRRKYTVRDQESGAEFAIENEYIMSAKDLCTIGFLDKVVASGISVLKIEGRGRAEEYVYTVTKCYREALDAIADGTYSRTKIEDWESRLATVFNRGFWDGYYLGRKLGEWHTTDGSAATQKKIYVGKAMHYYSKAMVAEIRLDAGQLKLGDQLMISGPTSGVQFAVVDEMRMLDRQVDHAQKGDVISIPLKQKVRESDKVYKLVAR